MRFQQDLLPSKWRYCFQTGLSASLLSCIMEVSWKEGSAHGKRRSDQADAQRQFFGVRSEKTKAPDKKQEQQDATAEPAKTVEVKSHTRQRKPKATRKELYANLPVREIVIPLTEEERRCPYCNAEMTTIGYTDVREELRITPAKVERILYKQEVAVCPECRKDGDGTLVKATTPTALFPHSPASASIVAYVMYHKTFVGTPYYRQESGMFQLGVKLPRETMANWCIQGAGNRTCALNKKIR